MGNIKNGILWGMLFSFSFLRADFNYTGIEDNYAGNLGAGVSSGYHRLALYNNPAAILPSSRGFSLSYRNPYKMEAVNQINLSGFWDFSKTGSGFSIHQFKIEELYLEQHLQGQLSFHPFFPLQFGTSGTLHRIEVQGEKERFSGTAMVGFILSHSIFKFGALGSYTTSGYSSDLSLQNIPYQFGFQLELKKGHLLLDISRNIYGDYHRKFSQVYQFSKYLELSYGVTDLPFQISFGLNIKFREYDIEAASQYHPNLGFSKVFNAGAIFK